MNKYEQLKNKLANVPMSAEAETLLAQVDEAVRFMMRDGAPTICGIASRLCITPSKLRRDIRLYLDFTPSDYIMLLRLSRALQLLDFYPRHSVAYVGEQCGFFDHAHFTHTFIDYFGLTPTQYIKKKRAESRI